MMISAQNCGPARICAKEYLKVTEGGNHENNLDQMSRKSTWQIKGR